MSEANLLLALDLGTTTLAGRLLAADGTVLAEAQAYNPQRVFGADIIRRLEAALNGEGAQLQRLLVAGMREVIDRLLAETGLPRTAIAAAAAAGNPGISYLLRGLPVDSILFPPHRPREVKGLLLDLPSVGLDLPVPLYLFPLVSGYVGGDLVAFIYGLDADSASHVPHTACRLVIDIGTNGEIALFKGGRWLATSVAAGPAFEGGEIGCGMAARPGAVEGVEIAGDSLRLRVIGGGMPQGLCGSGLVSAVAAARDGGLLDTAGTLVDPQTVPTNLARYIVDTPDGRALRLYRDADVDLLLTQEDIRNFQLAKAALRAGIDCLLQRAEMDAEDIRQVVVSGAFGLSLSPQVLKRIAMLPKGMIDRVFFSPGGALAGISRFLQSQNSLYQVQALADAIRPYPLSGTPAFEKAFLRGIDFKN
jgi:uncharacterized 2Fe-2S/4Fe-4S cluster protein (DUF4445 family)